MPPARVSSPIRTHRSITAPILASTSMAVISVSIPASTARLRGSPSASRNGSVEALGREYIHPSAPRYRMTDHTDSLWQSLATRLRARPGVVVYRGLGCLLSLSHFCCLARPRIAERLGKCMVSNRPADSPITIIEGINHLEPKMGNPCSGNPRHLLVPIQGTGLVVPLKLAKLRI